MFLYCYDFDYMLICFRGRLRPIQDAAFLHQHCEWQQLINIRCSEKNAWTPVPCQMASRIQMTRFHQTTPPSLSHTQTHTHTHCHYLKYIIIVSYIYFQSLTYIIASFINKSIDQLFFISAKSQPTTSQET